MRPPRSHPVIVSIVAAVALVAAPGMVMLLIQSLRGDPPVPVVTLAPSSPTQLRPFVVGPTTCLGTVEQRVETLVTRENVIPLPWVPDVPLLDDRYRANVVVEGELCVDGIDGIGDRSPVRAVTTGDGIEIVVNQAAGAITFKARVNALYCTPEEWAADEPCMDLSGGPSLSTTAIELLPWTASGNNLQEIGLAAAQVYGTSPQCLIDGMETVAGADLQSLLLATFQHQAQQQGLAVDKVTVALFDRDGQPTTEWDPSRQVAEHAAAVEQFEAALAANTNADIRISHATSCDVSGFGTTAPDAPAPGVPASEAPSLFPTPSTEWHPPMAPQEEA